MTLSSAITPTFTPQRLAIAFSVSVLSLALAGCGSDSDGGSSSNGGGVTPPPATMTFSQSATWAIDSTQPGANCYDFDVQKEVSCEGTTWDIKFDNQSRSVQLWSNSGTSRQGKGGVFGLLDWSNLSQYTNATTDPETKRDISSHYLADSSAGVFSEQPWYEYNLQEKHQLYPNNRVYLVTTDNSDVSTESQVNKPVYALQVINYYNDSGTAGYPTLRWIDTALPTQVKTQTFDASSYEQWVYINLATGKTTTKDGDWQVGINRMNMVLNGGDSGSAKVGGYVAKTPAGYYNEKGEPITSQFIKDNAAATLADLTDVSSYAISKDGVPWVKDIYGSDLNPGYTGNYPTLDYGWYTYDGMTHKLSAKPEASAKGALIRSAEGNSYARIRLDEIVYANPNVPAATQWVYKLDIQPAPAK